MQSLPGELTYTSPGSEEVCGLYVIGLPDQIIEIEFLDFDVRCDTGGLLAVRLFRPEKIPVFLLTCRKNVGSVGRKIFLFFV